MLFSRDAAHFATGDPDIRDFTLTNEVALGGRPRRQLGAGSRFLRSSVGQVVGGPLVDKNFPAPGGGFLGAAGGSRDAALLVGELPPGRAPPATTMPLNDEGEPYTTREGEVTDMRQLARTMFEAPANFTEQYFPTRILTDVARRGAAAASSSCATTGPTCARGC